MIKQNRILAFSLIALSSLACNTVMGLIEPTPVLSELSGFPTREITPALEETTYNLSYDDQVDIFYELWEIVHEEYLYDDFNGVDWPAVRVDYEAKIEAGYNDQEFYAAMDEVIKLLRDDHSTFLDPFSVAQEEAEYAGEKDYAGIGIWVSPIVEENKAVVLLVFPESPAEAAGVLSHDSILAVDFLPIVDAEGAMVTSILGEVGSKVWITVQTPGETSRDLEIERAQITGGYHVPYEVITTPDGKQVGYIFIPTFSDDTIDAQ
ncbi:MAG: hypothetical protein N2D54_11265, partial [Chloroflexota bacterium]